MLGGRPRAGERNEGRLSRSRWCALDTGHPWRVPCGARRPGAVKKLPRSLPTGHSLLDWVPVQNLALGLASSVCVEITGGFRAPEQYSSDHATEERTLEAVGCAGGGVSPVVLPS